MSTPEDIVLVGVKRTVIAFRVADGTRLWSTTLSSGLSEDFVSIVADSRNVFAHTLGKFYCLDLQTGRVLWSDKLSGFGYGMASIAIPGLQSSPVAPAARARANAAASASAGTGG